MSYQEKTWEHEPFEEETVLMMTKCIVRSGWSIKGGKEGDLLWCGVHGQRHSRKGLCVCEYMCVCVHMCVLGMVMLCVCWAWVLASVSVAYNQIIITSTLPFNILPRFSSHILDSRTLRSGAVSTTFYIFPFHFQAFVLNFPSSYNTLCSFLKNSNSSFKH